MLYTKLKRSVKTRWEGLLPSSENIIQRVTKRRRVWPQFTGFPKWRDYALGMLLFSISVGTLLWWFHFWAVTCYSTLGYDLLWQFFLLSLLFCDPTFWTFFCWCWHETREERKMGYKSCTQVDLMFCRANYLYLLRLLVAADALSTHVVVNYTNM